MNISKSLRLTLPIRSLALLSLALLPISSAWCRDASGGPPVPVLIPGAIILSDSTSISQFEIPSGRTRIICTGCGSVSKLRVGRDSYIYYSAAETSWCGLLDDVMWRLDPDSGLTSTLPRGFLARDMTGGSFTFAERNIYGVTAGVCGPAGHPSLTPWVFRQLVPDGSPIPISILTDPSQGYVPLFIGDFLWAYNTRGLTVDRDGKLILATPDELIRIDPSSGSRELLYGSMATGGGIAGFTIETEPAGTLLYVRRWWTSDRPSGLYRVSPIPPAPFSVSPPPQLVAAQPFNLYNAPDRP